MLVQKSGWRDAAGLCICNLTTGGSIMLPDEETWTDDEDEEHVVCVVSFGLVP